MSVERSAKAGQAWRSDPMVSKGRRAVIAMTCRTVENMKLKYLMRDMQGPRAMTCKADDVI